MRRLVGAAAMLALAACGGSLFQSRKPPVTVYQLSVEPAAAAAGPEIPVDLEVLMPRVRTGLDNDLIAALYPDRRLDYFAAARWSGPLDALMQDLALEALRGRANFRAVRADDSAFGSGYWIEIDVLDFQAEYPAGGGPPTVHVRLLASVGKSLERRIVGKFSAEQRREASEDRMTAIVGAYNEAAGAALAEIAADAAAALGALPR